MGSIGRHPGQAALRHAKRRVENGPRPSSGYTPSIHWLTPRSRIVVAADTSSRLSAHKHYNLRGLCRSSNGE